jgi:dihydroxyacid dehydratase/phosphogluconate dehydratase
MKKLRLLLVMPLLGFTLMTSACPGTKNASASANVPATTVSTATKGGMPACCASKAGKTSQASAGQCTGMKAKLASNTTVKGEACAAGGACAKTATAAAVAVAFGFVGLTLFGASKFRS